MWRKFLWSTFGLLFPATLGLVVSSDDNGYFLASLHKSLFEGNYTSTIRPHCSERAVNVTIDVGLREIVDLSEKQETIKLKIWVRLNWEDCNLKWNTTDFGGISKMVVPYDKLWIPDVTLLEGINEIANMPGMKQYRTLITNLGKVHYQFPTTVHMSCGMNIAKFPYDYQICTMTFGSWIHTFTGIEMFSKSDIGNLTSFINDQEWIVVRLQAAKITELYNCCDEPFSSISYKLVIKHKATFYIITMILLFFALTILSIAGFVFPSNSGEKITFHMTILLAVTVFLLLIHDTFPSSSEFFPIIGIYFTITLLLMCLSCVMSAIVFYFHKLGDKKMPEWVQKHLVNRLDRLLCKKNSEIGRGDNQNVIKETSKTGKSNSAFVDDSGTRVKGNENQNERKESEIPPTINTQNSGGDNSETKEKNENKKWEHLVIPLDRFFTVFYILVTTLNTTAFLIVLSQNDEP
ncbi:neuronal acetylcholine receptor subunit alpha-10-like [Ostrea edulis]|uniref:neuronal acetylcholine receptor subunit alpha-10-like n=1 Tax=Ostrea edulis TaxID=37623 RepID=UPI002095BB85|nr:neuronal acetylcholine receptor subunit alpha-10-like [Ostrea edulis]